MISSYLNTYVFYFMRLLVMNKVKDWMLITYYCPTHGDYGRIEPVEIKRKEIGLFDLSNEKTQKKKFMNWNRFF